MTLNDTLFGLRASAQGTLSMAGKLALRGWATSPSTVHCNARPYCDAPVTMGRRTHHTDDCRMIEVSMLVACRKCNKCLQFRRLQWRDRIEREYHRTPGRVWFVTLTIDPILLAGILAEAALRDSHVPWERRIDDSAYKHVQRYLKRVRKSGARFRYLFVFERGAETGRPHYHALVHEVGPQPVTYRQIVGAWPAHVHAKLITDTGANMTMRYISKYLGKSFNTRPRSSILYGTKKKTTTHIIPSPVYNGV